MGSLEQFFLRQATEHADEERAAKQAVEEPAVQEAVPGRLLCLESRPVHKGSRFMFLEDGNSAASRL
jgi:hypothetical protein